MGIVTFVSDDLSSKDWDFRDIFISRGIGCVIPVIFNNLGNQVSINNLKILENAGYEIAGHSVSHTSLDQLPYPQLRYEVQECRRKLLDSGFDCQNFAVPFGNYNNMVLDTCNRFYRGTRTSDIGQNISPYNMRNLKTYWLDGGADISVFKTQIDLCAQNNTWLILSFHTNSASQNFMNDMVASIIDYCLANDNIEVMTMKSAQNALGISPAPDVGDPYSPPLKFDKIIYRGKEIHSIYFASQKIKYNQKEIDKTLYSLPNGISDEEIIGGIIRKVGHIILDGSEVDWAQYSQFNATGRFAFRLPYNLILDGQSNDSINITEFNNSLISYSYTMANNDKTLVGITQYDISSVPNIVVRLQSGMFSPTNLSGFKTWLINNPLHILFALKTPYSQVIP